MTQFTPLAMTKKLVSYDTTSRDSNLALIEFAAGYLKDLGVDATLIHNAEKNKANLYATIGPTDVPGVVLSGHTDVVPVDGQDWSTAPFEPVESGGRLFGRGTSDMKSFIATALALAPEMIAADLKMPIHFAFSYDEEVGCLGVHGIVSHLSEISPLPRAVIVGEPTDMKVVNAHKGVFAFHTSVHGFEAHSSATHIGVNAVMYAAQLVSYLSDLAAEQRDNNGDHHRFEPPHTTVHVGTIRGGTALNIIPKECSFVWEYRLIPGENEDAILKKFNNYANDVVLPKMKAVSEHAAIVTERLGRVAPLVPEPDSPAETLAMMLAGTNQTDVVSYGTEGGIFQEAGVPTVVCGPGNILQAHRPDEYIEIAQITACEQFLRRLIEVAKTQSV
ncbi:MAG: acetylornithine deacetylase [Planctomycetaceae bacterium]|jgi:acetylornithine deacetylase|nr:acetylornithine deacetylase [Planctomycetaceae bacterium]